MTEPAVHMLTGSAEQTMSMASSFASACRPGDVIGLQGTLGAGKTCFVKGLAGGLGVDEGTSVLSPTFVLLRCYKGRLDLYHFDAYRLSGSADMIEIGCAEVFDAGGVSVVEWADHVAGCLPAEHFVVAIAVCGATRREFHLTGAGPQARGRLPEFNRALAEWLA